MSSVNPDQEPSGMRKLLFVDDEVRVLDGLRRLLRAEREQWDMTFVDSVERALELLETDDYDAVVSDFNMPRRNGIDLLRAVRRDPRTADIPVVILTGNGEPEMKRRALDEGATDLLNKPVEKDDLLARLRSALRLKQYMDEIKDHRNLLEQRVRERTAQLEYSRAEVIWRLGKAGEFRDSDTGFHVVRVGLYARKLAETMGLEAAHSDEIFLSAPLHDIGKIGIPDRILLKPGKLDADEWEIMKTHAAIGGQILRAKPIAQSQSAKLAKLAQLDDVVSNPFAEIGAVIAENHHENWDGSGYPLGRVGKEIPISARITSVADVYDALCSKRPYKQPFTDSQVLKMMRQGSGTKFDPEVCQAFEDSLADFHEIRSNFCDDQPSELHGDMTASLEGFLDSDAA